ncbi:MAG: sugar kinase [Actinobacteria bacterium]|nr:sugar kinase [Actinomycetota bacterium]
MPEFDVVSIGECMVEFYSDRPLSDSEKLNKSYGGDTISVLVAASRLGSRTGYITRVGEDPFASYLLQSWLNEMIDLSLVRVIPARKNGIYFVSTFEGGGYDLSYYREGSAASTISVDDLETKYLAAARYLHASGVSQAISKSCRRAVYEACRLVKENRTGLVSYDPHLESDLWSAEEAKVAFHEVLPYMDVLFIEHPFESKWLNDIADPEELIRALWQQGIRVVVLKLEDNSCIVGERHSGIIGVVEAFRAGKVVDKTGAGDAFCGAFLHGLARGFDIFQAARLGNIVTGLKLTGRGAIASMPTHDEVYRLFEAA